MAGRSEAARPRRRRRGTTPAPPAPASRRAAVSGERARRGRRRRDRPRRAAARRRRRAQRRRPAAERAPRQARPSSARSCGPTTPRSRRSSSAAAVVAEDRAARAQLGLVPADPRPDPTYVHLGQVSRSAEPSRPAAAPRLRRRLRRHARSAPRGSRACGRRARRAWPRRSTTRRSTIPAGRGTIYDRRGVQLAIGEQATTVYANPRQVTRPARAAADAPARSSASTAAAARRALADRAARLRLRRAQGRPGRAPRSSTKRHLPGLRLVPGGAARLSAAHGRGAACSATRASTTTASPGSSSSSTGSSAGKPGSETVVKDPFGRVLDVVSSTPERHGPRRLPHDRPHDPVRRRGACSATTVAKWHAKDATAIVLDPRTGGDPRDGGRAGLRREPLPRRARVGAAEPRGHGHVRARLDVQARHRRGRALGGARHAATPFTLPYDDPGRRPRDPRRRAARHRDDVTVAEILARSSNVGAITLAKLLGPQRLERLDHRFGFGRDDRDRLPRREPGLRAPARPVVGLDDRQRADRPGHRGHADPDGSAYAAIANGGVWRQPHLVDHVAGRPRPRTRRAGSSRRRVARELDGDAEERRPRRHGHRRPPSPATRSPARPARRRSRARTATRPAKYVASFVGFVPASRPRLVILVAVDEPQTAIWGGTRRRAGVPEIAKFDLQYLEVPPDAPQTDAPRRGTRTHRLLPPAILVLEVRRMRDAERNKVLESPRPGWSDGGDRRRW